MIFIKGATHCAGVSTAPLDVKIDPSDVSVSHAGPLPDVRDAEHESSTALPLIPLHVQEKDVVHDIADAVPVVQRLMGGGDLWPGT